MTKRGQALVLRGVAIAAMVVAVFSSLMAGVTYAQSGAPHILLARTSADIVSKDGFALYRDGDTSEKVEANSSFDYNCDTKTLTVTVRTVSGVTLNPEGSQFVKIDGSTKASSPSNHFDQTSNTRWEASFGLPEGEYSIAIQAQVISDGGPQTATIENGSGRIEIRCTPEISTALPPTATVVPATATTAAATMTPTTGAATSTPTTGAATAVPTTPGTSTTPTSTAQPCTEYNCATPTTGPSATATTVAETPTTVITPTATIAATETMTPTATTEAATATVVPTATERSGGGGGGGGGSSNTPTPTNTTPPATTAPVTEATATATAESTVGGAAPTELPTARQAVAGATNEEEGPQPTAVRNRAVAGVSEDISESASPPRALLPSTGVGETAGWLLLTLAMIALALGSSLRVWQIRRK